MRSATIDRARHGQLLSSATDGDCFRASMSVILDVPNGDHLPVVEEGWWIRGWDVFLDRFGLSLEHASAAGPIWKSHRWIASVPSKNFPDVTHAIVMDGHKVEFDPSPKRRYRRGVSLLGSHIVLGGYWLEVADVTRFPALTA